MYVVIHQHIGMQQALGVEQGFAQQGQVVRPVNVIQKAGKTIVAVLHDVLRNVGEIKTELTGHDPMIAAGTTPR